MKATKTIGPALGSLLAACAPPPPLPPPPPPPVVVATPTPTPIAVSEPQQPPTAPPIERPACRFGPQQGDVRGRLWFSVDGAVFADFGGEIDLEGLEVGLDGRVRAVVDDGRVRLEADVLPETLRLAPTDPTPLDGWLMIHAGRVATVEPGALVLDVEVRSFEPAGQLPSLRFSCERLSVVAPPQEREWGHERLKAGARAPLRPSRSDAPVGMILGPKPAPTTIGAAIELNLTTLEEKGASTRIRLDGEEASVTGWIPSSTIDTARVGLLGVLAGSGTSGTEGSTIRCDRDVPLQVAVGDRRTTVGTLHADASLPAVDASEDGWHVDITDSTFIWFRNPPRVKVNAFIAPTHRRYCTRGEP